MKKITACVLSLAAFLALAVGTAFASHDMACCKAPRHELLQEPGYAMLPVNATEPVFPFWT